LLRTRVKLLLFLIKFRITEEAFEGNHFLIESKNKNSTLELNNNEKIDN
jgi:hypothetical protein